jgi:hypothetical protein
MSDASSLSDEELIAELGRRRIVRCRCGKWTAYLGAWDADGLTLRCFGCRKAIGKCTC